MSLRLTWPRGKKKSKRDKSNDTRAISKPPVCPYCGTEWTPEEKALGECFSCLYPNQDEGPDDDIDWEAIGQ